MMKSRPIVWALTAACLVFLAPAAHTGAFAQEDGKAVRSYAIPEHGDLVLRMPRAWTEQVRRRSIAAPPTITLRPLSQRSFVVSITVLSSHTDQEDFTSAQNIRRIVDNLGRKILPSAKEKEVVIKGLQSGSGVGYYLTVTDNSPQRRDYRYMTLGALGVDKLILSFTLMTTSKNPAALAPVLDMLRDAELVAPGGSSSVGSAN